MKPDRNAVIGQFKGFNSGTPTEEQIKYYTSRPWNVLNDDLLVLNHKLRMEAEAKVAKLTKELANKPSGEYIKVTDFYIKKEK